MEEPKLNYMNPITFEAEMFVNSLESLSKNYNNIDAVLVASLEKVVIAIEKFIDSSPSEILETKNVKLVKCDDVSRIKRIYCCTACKRDLGKSAEKVALHMMEDCDTCCNVEGASLLAGENVRVKSESRRATERELKKIRSQVRVEMNPKKKEIRKEAPKKLTRKTQALLINLSQFIEEHVQSGIKFKCVPSYEKVEQDLLNLIRPLFPKENVKVYKFGSRMAGIGHRESDLDLYIDIGDTFNVCQNRANTETLLKLHKVARAFERNNRQWKGLIIIDKARVPVLKVIHAGTNIECDINFSNSLGTINTKLLEYIFNLQPIAQLLCIFMKKWLSLTKLNDDINTYTMTLMVLFYLQTKKLVPSVKQLQENVNDQKALKVGHWLCTYVTSTLSELNIPKERADQPNLLKFIRNFFVFYINFDFGNNVVCPYLGEIVNRIDVENLMPTRYIEFVQTFTGHALELEKPIVVQDPIQLNHNTTKNLSDLTLKTLRGNMTKSLELLNETFLADV